MLDPQQRLLLEVTWEAIEDAGLVFGELAGSDTGVFVGGFMLDGLLTQFGPQNREQIGTHTAVSSTLAILANRLSHAFDLRGPSLTVDTACSSSLVATHLACEAIRRGECRVALCGGVNVIFRPEPLVAMCKGGFLASDGRSKSFDARADGYGRGEGAAVVVLKPLADAERDGDDIYAVIRGTGVNQDGRTEGITVPNADAQTALIRRVCAAAGVAPATMSYVEAHGTGTALGDPLEASALGATVGRDRHPDRPCPIGSVKANIGHLEAAAGIAGLVKAALCLKHNAVPPIANLDEANPAIPFAELGLRLPRALEPLGDGSAPAFVGVNSFGYGGTNAHVVLAQAAPSISPTVADAPPANEASGPVLLPLSAKTPEALRELARRFAAHLKADLEEPVAAVCRSAALRRHHHEQRLAVVGAERREVVAALRRHAEGVAGDGVVVGSVLDRGAKPVFVFTGMGPQWWGMGRELFATEPVARAFAERADAIFREIAGWSILEEMGRDEASSRMARTGVAQPANFVLQGALHALWREWGVEPAAILGHSVGEVTAAFAAGVLTLEEAVAVSFHRSRIQQRAAGQGAMLAVALGEADVLPLVYRHHGAVSMAAVNGPASVTLAGEQEPLAEIAAELEAAGTFHRWLKVEVPYHSAFMEPLKPELRHALAHLRPRSAAVTLYSTVRGELARAGDYDAEYWCDNIREPVYFAPAIESLIDEGCRLFLEIGPHPVLSTAIAQTLEARLVEGRTLASLRRGRPEASSMREALAGLFVHGAGLDWKRIVSAGHRPVRLPTYPFQREKLWTETALALRDRLGDPQAHPLLGSRADAPTPAWSSRLNAQVLPWLADHVVENLVVLPGAAYVELALAAQHARTGAVRHELRDLTFSQALVVGDLDEPLVSVTCDEDERTFTVASRSAAGGTWTTHAQGTLSSLPFEGREPESLAAVRARCGTHRTAKEHLADMAARGLAYGSSFQAVRDLWLGVEGGEALAMIRAVPAVAGELDRYRLHPTLLDGAFQTLLAAATAQGDPDVYVPVRIDVLRLLRPATGPLWCHARCRRWAPGVLEGDIALLDDAGEKVAEALGVEARALSRRGAGEEDALADALYEFEFELAERQEVAPACGPTAVIAIDPARGEALADALATLGVVAVTVAAPRDGAGRGRDAGAAMLRRAQADAPLARVVYLATSAPGGETGYGLKSLERGLDVLQAALEAAPEAEICVLTQLGLAAPGDHPVDPAAAALVGLARTALNEHADRTLRTIDAAPTTAAGTLALEIVTPSDEDTVLLRDAGRYVARLRARTAAALEARAYRREPGAGEVECGLRVRLDAASALAVVTACGPGVVALAPGDAVLVRLPASLGPSPFVNVSIGAVASLPAAGHLLARPGLLPLAVARHALCTVARIGAGSTVVIDLGDGLVGRAAAELAAAHGARTIMLTADASAAATAHVNPAVATMSRDEPDSLERLEAALGVAGADALVTDATGERRERLTAHLAPFGRLVAIGDAAAAGAPPRVLDNRVFAHLDPQVLVASAPEAFARLVEKLADEVEAGRVPELDRIDAGELVDLGRAHLEPVALEESAPRRFDPEGTYLVTGGFGGLGLALAGWLVEKGVRHLALMSRSGPATPAAEAALAELRARGASVTAVKGDVADRADVERTVAAIEAAGRPLRGVFHTAGVLDDGPFAGVRAEQLVDVMRPKALGAWHLHVATCDRQLTCFVLFSSLASLVASPGQATYVAANSYLDALAHRRRRVGLPAMSVNLGALAEIGMAARHEGVEQYLKRVGVGSIPPARLLRALERMLAWNPVQIGFAPMDWGLWGATYPAWARSSRYRHLMPAEDPRSAGNGGVDRLRDLPEAERAQALEGILGELLAPILRTRAEDIDASVSLLNLGLDSLMAIETQTAIERRVGLRVATLELLRGDSIKVIARNLARNLAADDATARAAADDRPVPAPAHLDETGATT